MADGEWELYYHPLAGRAEFIRVIFEEAGVNYKDISDIEILRDGIKGGQRKDFFPTFAPPMIKKGSFTLGQTPAICKYLGKVFGLYPESREDEAHADQLNTTIHDYIGEGRLVFHGRGFIESYYTQKEETQPYIDWFLDGRMQRWLEYLERALIANDGGNGFILGDKLTYVDLGLLHVLRATESQFPSEWAAMSTIPQLKAFKQRVAARPKLAEYFKSDRCRPFEGNSMM